MEQWNYILRIYFSDDSIDDSVYFGTEDIDTEDIDTEDFGENIYDEISEAPGVTNIVDEIIAVEEFYIERLNYAVNNYVEPSRLMGDQMKAVFGNMEEIKKFHEDTFYPDLKQCNKDLIRILECFSKHISVITCEICKKFVIRFLNTFYFRLAIFTFTLCIP